MNYTYDPAKIRERGKDQMRFELGDTVIGGGPATCALADEEYEAMLEGINPGKRAWMLAKIQVLEAILLKLSYQVDTKVDVLWYELGKRAEQWEKLYEMLRKQMLANMGVPTMSGKAQGKPPYFHTGMDDNQRAMLPGAKTFPFKKITT